MFTRLITTQAGRWPGGVLLAGLCLAAYLPGLTALPPIDGDEARYAEAAREMAAAHNLRALIVPHIQDAPRFNKPPLVYWLEAASAYLLTGGSVSELSFPAALRGVARPERTSTGSPATRTAVFTGGIWVYRIPSLLATVVAVLITWRLGLRMFAPPCAWLAAALLGGCFLVVVDARLARTDQVLLACTCAAQWALWNIWRAPSPRLRWVMLFWIAVALGIMTKGPVTPGVALLTLLALWLVTGETSWMRRMRWGMGVLIVAAIFLPWLILLVVTIGWEPLTTVLRQELLERGLSAEGGRGGPPGYHLALLPGLFWPGGLLVVPAFLYALKRGLRRPRTAVQRTERAPAGPQRPRGWRLLRAGRPAELFCLAWIVPAWVVCEFVGTKLPHYTLPLYPAVALLCARAAWAGVAGTLPLTRTRMAIVGDALWLLIGAALTVGLPLYLAWAGELRREPFVIVALVAGVVLLIALLSAAWAAVRRRRYVAALLIGLGVSFIGGHGLFQTVLPNLDLPWANSTLVREIASIDPDGERPLASAGYNLESLVFMTGGRMERIGTAGLERWFERHPGGLVVAVEGEYFAHTPARVLAAVRGFNYVEGRHMVLQILECAAAGDAPSAETDGHLAVRPAPRGSR